ncbi:MAG: META domain-containing protein [Candidatus Electrothrix sp. Rat3]|nr:META domain-containing protein [Candidatus Electrothrix rattekaaiensis]
MSLALTTDAYALGARGDLTCYNSCRNYSIETTANYDSEDRAAQVLYNDALAFCSDKGGLANHRVDSFFSAENIQLPGTSWEVTDYNDGRELVDINSYQKLDIRFEEDGTVQGASFCNDYTGYYTVSEDKISMRPVATFGVCEGLMRQEELFLEALRDAARYETRGDQLILEDDNGTVVALLVRK